MPRRYGFSRVTADICIPERREVWQQQRASRSSAMANEYSSRDMGSSKAMKPEDLENIFYYAKNDKVLGKHTRLVFSYAVIPSPPPQLKLIVVCLSVCPAELADELTYKPDRIREVDERGASLLHCAAMNNRLDTMNLLFSRGINIFTRDKNGSTALHYSMLRGQEESSRILLDKGLSKVVNEANQLGMTILHDVCYFGKKSVVFLLIGYGADINVCDNMGRTPLDMYGTNPGMPVQPDGKAR